MNLPPPPDEAPKNKPSSEPCAIDPRRTKKNAILPAPSEDSISAPIEPPSAPRPPSAPSKPLSKKTRMGILLCVIALTLTIGALLGINAWLKYPSTKEVEKFLATELKTKDLVLESVSITKKEQAEAGITNIDFIATCRPAASLFRETPIEEIAKNTPPAQLAAYREIKQLINADTENCLFQQKTIPSTEWNLTNTKIIEETANQSNRYKFHGRTSASKTDGWKFSLSQLQPDEPYPPGKPRGAFPGHTLLAPQDNEKIAELLAEAPHLLADTKAILKKHNEALTAPITPGEFYTGAAYQSTEETTPISIEFIKLQQDEKTFELCIRNDGGYTEKRRITGQFRIEGKTISLEGHSEASEHVENAGPLLGDNKRLKFKAQIENGSLKATCGAWSINLNHLDEARKKAQLEILTRDERNLKAACALGKTFIFEIEKPESAWCEKLYLTFRESDDNSSPIKAELTSINGLQKRIFRAHLRTNHYQSNGMPLRLVSERSAAIPSDETNSPLTWRFYPIIIEFSYDGETFKAHYQQSVLQSGLITLKPTDKINVIGDKIANKTIDNDLATFLRSGSTLNGIIAHNPGDYTAPTRVIINQTEQGSNALSGSGQIDSLEVRGLTRNFRFELRTGDAEATLTFSELDGNVKPPAQIEEPWFLQRKALSATLRHTGNGLEITTQDGTWLFCSETAAQPKNTSAAANPFLNKTMICVLTEGGKFTSFVLCHISETGDMKVTDPAGQKELMTARIEISSTSANSIDLNWLYNGKKDKTRYIFTREDRGCFMDIETTTATKQTGIFLLTDYGTTIPDRKALKYMGDLDAYIIK